MTVRGFAAMLATLALLGADAALAQSYPSREHPDYRQ